jgi:hypothetical protein
MKCICKTKKKDKKTNYLKTSITTPNELYEMVFDRSENKTSFIKIDRDGKIESLLEEVEIGGRKYRPLPPDYNLVDKNVILFPSLATPYESEEEILTEVQNFIHKHLDISEVFEHIATYYVLFTWLFDKFNEVPYSTSDW